MATNRLAQRQEPSFGPRDTSNEAVAERATEPRPAPHAEPTLTTAGHRARKPRAKKKSGWLRFFFWLVFLSGVLGGGGYYAYQYYNQNIVSLAALDTTTDVTVIPQEQYTYVAPEADQPILTLEQIRWCLRQQIRIDVLAEVVSTTAEINKVASMERAKNAVCTQEKMPPDVLELASKQIAGVQPELFAEAQDEQLYLLSELSSRWERSDTVAEIQQHLQTLGYDVGAIDGLFGLQTQTSIKAFEKDNGIPEAGQVSEELLELLRLRVAVTQ